MADPPGTGPEPGGLGTHYQALGLEPDASPDQVRRRYWELMPLTHPDAIGDRHLFDALTAAYQVLAEPGSRRDYDRSLRDDGPEPPAIEPAPAVESSGWAADRWVTIDDDPVRPSSRRWATRFTRISWVMAAVHLPVLLLLYALDVPWRPWGNVAFFLLFVVGFKMMRWLADLANSRRLW